MNTTLPVLRYDRRRNGPVIYHPIIAKRQGVYAEPLDLTAPRDLRCRTLLPAIVCDCGRFLLEAVDSRAAGTDPKNPKGVS